VCLPIKYNTRRKLSKTHLNAIKCAVSKILSVDPFSTVNKRYLYDTKFNIYYNIHVIVSRAFVKREGKDGIR